jgi:hypothetical protein
MLTELWISTFSSVFSVKLSPVVKRCHKVFSRIILDVIIKTRSSFLPYDDFLDMWMFETVSYCQVKNHELYVLTSHLLYSCRIVSTSFSATLESIDSLRKWTSTVLWRECDYPTHTSVKSHWLFRVLWRGSVLSFLLFWHNCLFRALGPFLVSPFICTSDCPILSSLARLFSPLYN